MKSIVVQFGKFLVETFPQFHDDLIAMVPDDGDCTVNRPLGETGIQPRFLPHILVPQPIGTPAHGIASHKRVRAHGHEDPTHRYSPLLERIDEVQNARGTEIMLHGPDQTNRNRYIVIRTGKFRPSHE